MRQLGLLLAAVLLFAYQLLPATVDAATDQGRATSAAHLPVGTATGKPVLAAPITFQLDDGTIDQLIGWGNSAANRTYAGIWLNHFSPGAITYPLTINTISIFWPSQSIGTLLNRQVRLLVYRDGDNDNYPGNATLIKQQSATIAVLDTWQTYTVNAVITQPGDLYIGFEDQWAEPGVAPRMYPASQDYTRSQGRSWIGAQSAAPYVPNIANLGANDHLQLEDLDGYPGNWLIRAGATSYDPPTATTGPVTATPTLTATPVPPSATATPPATLTPAASPTPCTAGVFSDVQASDYFAQSVAYLAAHGVVSGYSDCTFRPYSNTTRAQLAKIVVAGFNLPPAPVPGDQTFADVAPGSTFFPFIEAAADGNIISGYTCGTLPSEPCDSANRPYYRPGNNVTRGQLSKIVVLAAGWLPATPAGPAFTDVPSTNAFYSFVETAACHGIVSGYSDGTFRPGNPATRGQISKIVYLGLTNANACVPPPTALPTATSSPTLIASPTVTDIPTNTSTPGPPPPPVTSTAVPSSCAPGNGYAGSAYMSDPSPGANGFETVYGTLCNNGQPVAGAAMHTVWYYRTTTVTCDGTTGIDGVASCTRSIGRPTTGYTVSVSVSFSIGGATVATAATSFTPR